MLEKLQKENSLVSERKKVVVIGLGYVGLPLALHIANENYEVVGIDKDPRKIEALQNGKSYIPDVSDSSVTELKNGLFEAKLPENGIESLMQASYIIVTVPTPITKNDEPDLGALYSATHFIEQHLQNGQTLIYESSTYPGTMEEVVLPILSKKGLKVGHDFFLCYSPERIDPANKSFTLKSIPKIVSGQTDKCLEMIKSFYGTIFNELVPVSSPKIAELGKIFENTQRLVNISLVNEMDTLCRELDIDFYESLQAASTKPFGFTPYWPGPGIGGHCIPVDPLYLQWKLQQHGLMSELVQAASDINQHMPKKVIERVKKAMNKDERNILVIGLTYKKDVNDVRESPALMIFKNLLDEEYDVTYHDPYIPSIEIGNKIHHSIHLTETNIKEFDLVLILTDHSVIDYELITKAPNIIDTRRVLKKNNYNI
ncbi:nucleotide sugar dehydrogenase [Cytobacillus purgationiresistens]|nr:nucleotide sugar dehydrogenase [Cytobacillus purgationiresistens]